MDRTPERLKKELEEELLLSGEDLRSHAWYHGRIPRQVPPGPTTPQGHPPRPRGVRPDPAHTRHCTGRPWEVLRSGIQGACPRAQRVGEEKQVFCDL